MFSYNLVYIIWLYINYFLSYYKFGVLCASPSSCEGQGDLWAPPGALSRATILVPYYIFKTGTHIY